MQNYVLATRTEGHSRSSKLVFVSKMTYYVSNGTLNLTHSLMETGANLSHKDTNTAY